MAKRENADREKRVILALGVQEYRGWIQQENVGYFWSDVFECFLEGLLTFLRGMRMLELRFLKVLDEY